MKYGTSIGRLSFKIAVLNSFGKFLGGMHIQDSYVHSCALCHR